MKKIFFLSLFSLFLIPTITFASWWNPVSWFKKISVNNKKFSIVSTVSTTTSPFIFTTINVATTTLQTIKIENKKTQNTAIFSSKDNSKEIEDLKKQLNNIMVKHTGKSYEDIEKATDRDNYLDPRMAIDFGLIDSIIEKKVAPKPAV